MDRREAILQAAAELFAERGFHATTTSEVARRAGVAEGTIFHHFQTKEGILLYLFERIMEDYARGLRSILQGASSGLEALEGMIAFHFRFGRERSEELRVVMRDFPQNLMGGDSPYGEKVRGHISRILELTKECIQMGRRDGTLDAERPMDTAFLIRGLLVGLSRFMLLGPIDVPELSGAAMEFCRRALSSGKKGPGPHKGRAG
jgi:AcrR family transcriptional regulator